jgi:hypothetical protein
VNESLLKQHDEPAPQEDEQDVDGLFATSPYDTEGEMNYSGGLDHPSVLQFDRSRAQVIKQRNTSSEQDGYQVDVYLVEESRPDALLRDAGGAHGDVLVVRDRFRLLDGAVGRAAARCPARSPTV